jgi:predicted nucleic acid-binding protein
VSAEFVIDNSALIEFLTNEEPPEELRRTVLTGNGTAPELIDAEALSVLRKMWLAGQFADDDDALAIVRAVIGAPIARSPHRPLMERAWELRRAVTAYDALYVALAEQLEIPLATCDGKLAGSNGHRARIQLYPKSS